MANPNDQELDISDSVPEGLDQNVPLDLEEE